MRIKHNNACLTECVGRCIKPSLSAESVSAKTEYFVENKLKLKKPRKICIFGGVCKAHTKFHPNRMDRTALNRTYLKVSVGALFVQFAV